MKSDPELLPVQRPRCPKCQMRMVPGEASPGPEGFEQRPFECLRCGHRESQMVRSDPMRSDAFGWMSGERGHAASEHEVRDGQMVPKRK
jgi:hypothetical protein